MEVRRDASRAEWDLFLAREQPPTFLQSWAWGETQRAVGEEVVRLAAYDGRDIVGVAQAVTVTARRGRFLHVPHGPVIGPSALGHGAGAHDALASLVSSLREEAARRRLAFLRVSPIQEDTPVNRARYRERQFREAPIHLHADRLWVLDVTPSEEAILAGMRKTTRNLVRRAEREGVIVRLGNDALAVFLRLYAETARRESFVPFSRQAIEAEVAAFSARPNSENDFTVLRNTVKSSGAGGSREGNDILVGVAEHADEPIAAAVVPLTSWSAFYHHGASMRTREHVPASYALQWALIREAKRRGAAAYNFWGIAPRHPTPVPRHPWHGLTLFKTGFGGREVPLVPTQDLPLSPRYVGAYLVDTYRRWRRGL